MADTVTRETWTLSVVTDESLGRPLVDYNWDALPWVSGDIAIVNGRVVFRKNERIYFVGMAPAPTVEILASHDPE